MRDTNVIALLSFPQRPSLRGWIFRPFPFVFSCLVLVSPVFSQSGAPSTKGATTKGATTKATTKAASGAMTTNPDPDTLPPDYAPPKEKDPLAELDMPIALADEMEKLKKDDLKVQQILNKAQSDDASKAVIRNAIRYRLALMCQSENLKVENLNKLYDLRVKLRSFLNNAGSAAKSGMKPADYRAFRVFVMQEFVKQATPLLENNLYVRQQIVFLMGELEIVQEDQKNNIPVEAFTPALEPLVKVIVDPKQPESVKLPSVMALTRILKIGTPNVGDRTKIAEALISELKRSEAHWWYQMRVAGALGAAALDQLKQPIVVTALKEVVDDPKRNWAVRTEAAKSLGRVPIPPSSAPAAVVKSVADLALQLAKAAQQKPEDPQWKSAFLKVYLAYVPLDAKDVDATKGAKAGLLNNPATSAAAKSSYDLIVPMVSAILKDARLTAAMIAALETLQKGSGGPSTPPTSE